MILGRYNKTPAERKRYTIDYSEWLDTGELVSSVTFEVIPAGAGAVQVSTVTILTPATGVGFFIENGLVGVSYDLLVTIVTAGGQIKQDEIKISVKLE